LSQVAAELGIARLEIDAQSQQALGLLELAAPSFDQAEDVGGVGIRRPSRQYGPTGRIGLCKAAGLQVGGGSLEQRIHRSASLPDQPVLASQKKAALSRGTGRRP
jgi:hypothetical protein